MRVAVGSNGNDLSAPVSPVFGRCPTYVFVDTDTLEFEALSNPAISASGGAGIQAAQMVANQGAQAVITGNVGPNAFNMLASAGIQIYLTQGGTVRQAVESLKAGQLESLFGPSAGMHTGAGDGHRTGNGSRHGHGTGNGPGYGHGTGNGPRHGGWPGQPWNRSPNHAATRHSACTPPGRVGRSQSSDARTARSVIPDIGSYRQAGEEVVTWAQGRAPIHPDR